MRDEPGDREGIDSNIVHHRRIRPGETKRPPSVILSAAKDLARWAPRSFAALRMTTGEATAVDANWATVYMQGTGDLLQQERGDREGRPYMLCRIQGIFSSEHTHLWSYEQQDFRRVIKADDAYMLVTGTDVHVSERRKRWIYYADREKPLYRQEFGNQILNCRRRNWTVALCYRIVD